MKIVKTKIFLYLLIILIGLFVVGILFNNIMKNDVNYLEEPDKQIDTDVLLELDEDVDYEIDKDGKSKKDKKLIFKIYSLRLNCQTVILNVYGNGMYEYYDSYNIDVEPIVGNYEYDVSKVLENINNYKENNHGPYVLIDSNNKEFYLYDNNIELNEFLNSINISLDVCLK